MEKSPFLPPARNKITPQYSLPVHSHNGDFCQQGCRHMYPSAATVTEITYHYGRSARHKNHSLCNCMIDCTHSVKWGGQQAVLNAPFSHLWNTAVSFQIKRTEHSCHIIRAPHGRYWACVTAACLVTWTAFHIMSLHLCHEGHVCRYAAPTTEHKWKNEHSGNVPN